MSEKRLKALAEKFGFRITETNKSVTVSKFFKSKEFVGCDRFWLAAKYIRDFE